MRMTEWNFSNVRKNGMKEYLTSAFHPPMKIQLSLTCSVAQRQKRKRKYLGARFCRSCRSLPYLLDKYLRVSINAAGRARSLTYFWDWARSMLSVVWVASLLLG
eukprot:scaffold2377_cov153-Alexandrium_tamarense.AAC.1